MHIRTCKIEVLYAYHMNDNKLQSVRAALLVALVLIMLERRLS